MSIVRISKDQIRAAGGGDRTDVSGITDDIGGLPTQTYYTPDGRQIKSIPAWRDYVKKDSLGKVIERGIRDANFDKGWLRSMPEVKKPFCHGCDRWHDSQKEVNACIKTNKAFITKMSHKAKQEQDDAQADELTSLKKQVEELTALVAKLVKPNG